MSSPFQTLPLSQRGWHEQAAAIAYTPPAPPPAPGQSAANPFIPNPQLVRDD